MPRWLLQLAVGDGGSQLLIPYLKRGATSRGEADLLLPRRGRHRLDAIHVSTLFPMGFIRKGMRYPAALEVLVYPELFAAAETRVGAVGRAGEDAVRRSGRGHELHALRAFRSGDDPRNIHWKQTARTGSMIYMERESEHSRRLSILFDNGVGELADTESQERFERLVSEAATTALDHLARGFEVELVTRDRTLAFSAGPRQRVAVLEALALVTALPRRPEPLVSGDPRAPQIRVHMQTELAGARVAAGGMP